MTEELKQTIINEYINGESINHLHLKYKVKYHTVKSILSKNNISDNHTGRFYQEYEICDDYTKIHIKDHGEIKYCLIDIEDIEKCKSVGVWSISKAGYIMNCKTGIYLHRFLMNCPDDLEVDHIYHNTLDNRKSMLRIVTSSQQKMNTKRRTDNTSGQRGVYYDKNRDTWNVNINIGDNHFRKRFSNFDDAKQMANDIYKKYFGEYEYRTN